jgi:hypothetical protein
MHRGATLLLEKLAGAVSVAVFKRKRVAFALKVQIIE